MSATLRNVLRFAPHPREVERLDPVRPVVNVSLDEMH